MVNNSGFIKVHKELIKGLPVVKKVILEIIKQKRNDKSK